MSNVANASIDVIEKFKCENADVENSLNELRRIAWEAITGLKSECESKLKIYSSMTEEAEEFAAKARNSKDSDSKPSNVAQAENMVSYFRSQFIKIQEMIKMLDNFDSTAYPMIDKALVMVQNVNSQLQVMINVINEYKAYLLKI